MLRLQRAFGGFSIANIAGFYEKFYAPTWTVLYWLDYHSERPCSLQSALRAQAMAMLLHILDDHLTDGQVPTDNALLQVRTQAWMLLEEECDRLAADAPALDAAGLFDDYFSAVSRPHSFHEDLESYQKATVGEVAIGLIAPLAIAAQTGHDTRVIQKMYQSFGSSWRLLDDLRDAVSDAIEGIPSAVMYTLSEEGLRHWKRCNGHGDDASLIAEFSRYVDANCADLIQRNIAQHLHRAADLARSCDLPELACQYDALSLPVTRLSNEFHTLV